MHAAQLYSSTRKCCSPIKDECTVAYTSIYFRILYNVYILKVDREGGGRALKMQTIKNILVQLIVYNQLTNKQEKQVSIYLYTNVYMLHMHCIQCFLCLGINLFSLVNMSWHFQKLK